MTPAEHIKEIERAVEIYSRDFAIYCDTQALTDFRVCSVSLAALQGAIRAGVGAPAQAVPAPGVEAVSEREFKQFLSDVLTAAGLVTHGKKCKDLGRRLGEMSMRLRTAPKTAAAQAATAKQSPHPEYDKGFSDGWNRWEERQAAAPASQPFAYEFSRSNGDGTHSEHIERGRLQEVAPGRWEHSGLPRGALADKPIKALYTTPQTQPAAVPAGMEPVAHVSQETFNDDGTSDIIVPALPIGMALYAAPQPAAQDAPVDAESWLDLLAEARAALCERLDAFIDAAMAAQKDGA